MSEGQGNASRWGEPEQEQATQAPAGKPRARKAQKGQPRPRKAPADQPRARWGNPEPEQERERTPPPAAQPAGARWGAAPSPPARETEPLAPASLFPGQPPAPFQANGPVQAREMPQQASAQNAPVFPVAAHAPPPAALPLPLPLPSEKKDSVRQQRSSAWLEQLNAPVQPARPPRRTRPLRSRARRIRRLSLIAAPLSILLVLAALVVSIPNLRQRALRLFAGPTATQVPQGTLLAQSNVAGSVLSLNNQTYPLDTPGGGEWSVTVSHLQGGTYPLTISAPNYAPASGQVVIQPPQQAVVTAFLTLDKRVYTGLLNPASNLIPGQPLAAPIPAGAQYLGDQTAAQALKVSIGYRVISLVDTPDASVLVTDALAAQPPRTLLSGTVVPDVLFTTASTGAVVDEIHPNALPPAHFLLALTISFADSGQASFALAASGVLTATTASDSALVVPGGVSADPALLFALVGLSLEQGSNDTGFTCFGLLDTVNTPGNPPDPEDGFLFGANGGAAHYFFRWGQLWTTNAAAHALTPALPQANQDTLIQAQSILDAGFLGQPTGCT
jgi:hypothetical protein